MYDKCVNQDLTASFVTFRIVSGLPTTHQEKQNLLNECNRGLSPISEGLHFFEAASFSSTAFRQASCSPRHGAGKPIARA